MPPVTNTLTPLLEYVRARGGSVERVCARAGLDLDEAATPDLRIPPTQHAALFHAAATALGEDHPGIHVALALPRGAFGLVEYCTINAPTLLGAMERMCRFGRILDPLAGFRLHVTSTAARLSIQPTRAAHGAGRHLHEYTLTMLVNMGRDLLRHRWDPTRVTFANPRPPKLDTLRSTFGDASLVFDGRTNELLLDRALVDQPIPHADPALLAVLESVAARELAAVPQAAADVVTLTSQVVRRSFKDGPPSLQHTARALHMSPRTLQRRLRAEKWSYIRVVEQVREDTALELLKKPGTALSELAFFLGFADFSTFLRAFKRWTGTTPGRWRVQQQRRVR